MASFVRRPRPSARNNYLDLISNVAVAADSFKGFSESDKVEGISGTGLFYSYSSIAGPLRAGIQWSTSVNKFGFYFGFGFDF